MAESKKKLVGKEKPKNAIKAAQKENSVFRIILKVALYSIWSVIIIVALQFLVYLIFYKIFDDFSEKPIVFTFYSLIYYSLSVFVIIFAPKLIKKQPSTREELGLKGLPTFSDLGLGPVAFIVYLILAMILLFIFSLFPWFNANEAQDLGLSNYMGNTELIFTFFALALIAPIAEEIIFRGWLYDKLRKLIPERLSVLISIIIVSALFGLIHGQFNVAVNVFAISVIACLLREITGTIYAGIILHIIKNTIAFLLVYVYHIL